MIPTPCRLEPCDNSDNLWLVTGDREAGTFELVAMLVCPHPWLSSPTEADRARLRERAEMILWLVNTQQESRQCTPRPSA